MRPAQLPFVDWLKCLGILLIVTGHVAARPFNHLAPPIYPKQLGVALFLFVLGFGLANETRARRAVLFNRLFDLYLYALPLALIISAFAHVVSGRVSVGLNAVEFVNDR
jgi:peptidoglycan/LPS O-acetylase OafA/YrhL